MGQGILNSIYYLNNTGLICMKYSYQGRQHTLRMKNYNLYRYELLAQGRFRLDKMLKQHKMSQLSKINWHQKLYRLNNWLNLHYILYILHHIKGTVWVLQLNWNMEWGSRCSRYLLSKIIPIHMMYSYQHFRHKSHRRYCMWCRYELMAQDKYLKDKKLMQRMMSQLNKIN